DLRGATINVMVLAGLVVAIGVVVDDAIIDVENIVRRLRQARLEGRTVSTFRVVLDASVEVRSAITYATIINVVAIVPVLFLQGLSGSLRRSAAGVEGAATRPELARAIARTDSITVQLDAATKSLNAAGQSLANVVGRIDRGEGTLGKLSKDESLYNNMNTAATNLNTTVTRYGALAEDIQANPKKYINLRVF
ncbi:MAG: efflux RND transporter permease subunit, partial [Gemmatimonadetes bacterium]|nr:efflux RND transporter permease subunit [Gemmatimonadota bacterium]